VAAQVAIGGELEPLLMKDGAAARDAADHPTVADAATLKKGTRVWVPRVRAEADVLDLLPDGTVRVQAGAMRLVLPASELRLATEKPEEAEPKKKAARPPVGPANGSATSGARDPAGLEVALQTSDNTVDLRGLRSEDAVTLAVTFLDRSLNENRHVCFLVHGHGTGALKDAIRRELKSSPYVRFFRSGNSGEGGDGVTIAWLS
jgi:DNA mismatch repair protein MutS2